MAINYAHKRAAADRIIRTWGTRAVLRSATGDRECHALQVQLSSAERRNLRADADAVYLVSSVDVVTSPNHDKETLVILSKDGTTEISRNRMVVPAVPLQPADVVIYWELMTRGQTRAV